MKFLDGNGVTTLWNKIKSSFLSLNGGGIISGGSIELVGDSGDYLNKVIIESTSAGASIEFQEGSSGGDIASTIFKQGADAGFTINTTNGVIGKSLKLITETVDIRSQGNTDAPQDVILVNGENYMQPITDSELTGILV